ncbi:MAG: hypothetical protein HY788_17615 [Deltaproteobacteria bacterium]|nr:hypothetical protein [Deltaproteobacteria bacterium]
MEEAERRAAEEKLSGLLRDLYPLTQHSELYVYPAVYVPENDTLYVEVTPRSTINWARVAYQYAKEEEMLYDRDRGPYGIDGQPRVSYGGLVWVRYITDFEGSKVALQIWAQQPSHRQAEEQLADFYRLFREHEGIEPIRVFQRMWKAPRRDGGD